MYQPHLKPPAKENKSFLVRFFEQETTGGILLFIAASVAVILSNTPLQPYYTLLLDTPVEVRVGAVEIAKPLLLWINDGLMAVFFFLIGLELKRELLEGELAKPANIIMPGIGAIGGMAVPAGIYIAFNHNDPIAMQGWAIPAATDIAFALAILSLLGSRVPTTIKIFLTSLAIFDDIGAIAIIALFYTSNISQGALWLSLLCIPVLAWLNYKSVASKSLYLCVGVIMWAALLKSGVHATLAGVVLALFIPLKLKHGSQTSPLKTLEYDLHSVVALFILPVFAFANAGISFAGVGTDQLLHNIPMGIASGLFVGKILGIFGICWLAVKFGLTTLPSGISWLSLLGTATLCGVGFTMSLFIGSLAFEETQVNLLFDERLGIIIGSLASGIVGYLILSVSLPRHKR